MQTFSDFVTAYKKHVHGWDDAMCDWANVPSAENKSVHLTNFQLNAIETTIRQHDLCDFGEGHLSEVYPIVQSAFAAHPGASLDFDLESSYSLASPWCYECHSADEYMVRIARCLVETEDGCVGDADYNDEQLQRTRTILGALVAVGVPINYVNSQVPAIAHCEDGDNPVQQAFLRKLLGLTP
jgi:hypothetical protein